MAASLYWGLYTPSEAALAALVRLSELAVTHPDPLFRADLLRVLSEARLQLGRVAFQYAPKIDERIRNILEQESVRPPTEKSRHLKDNIHSQPFRVGGRGTFGAIGIASIEELDRTTNPDGGSDRPYWRVIEEGSDEWQPDLVGRQLFGKFQGPGGDSSRPTQDRFRQDSSFVFGGEGAGIGLVQRAIEPQHYLDRGREEMFSGYVSAMEAAGARLAKHLRQADERRIARVRAATLEEAALLRG